MSFSIQNTKNYPRQPNILHFKHIGENGAKEKTKTGDGAEAHVLEQRAPMIVEAREWWGVAHVVLHRELRHAVQVLPDAIGCRGRGCRKKKKAGVGVEADVVEQCDPMIVKARERTGVTCLYFLLRGSPRADQALPGAIICWGCNRWQAS